MWVVSLKSPSGVEYGIEKIFLMSYSRASYRGLKFFLNFSSICVNFIHIFRIFA